MGCKSPYTTNSAIRSALHKLWLHSRERSSAIKRDGYCCQVCGVKQSKAKGKEVTVNVHHLEGVKWVDIFEYVRSNLLVKPEHLQTLCVDCHQKEHQKEKT